MTPATTPGLGASDPAPGVPPEGPADEPAGRPSARQSSDPPAAYVTCSPPSTNSTWPLT